MNDLWTLDFEASGLNMNATYPIELGWYNGTIEREFLIIPDPSWGDYWDPESQMIHNIPRPDLFKYGKKASEICEVLNDDLNGKTVWCDGGQYDAHWMRQLLDVGGVDPTFQMANHFSDFGNEIVRHRALDDAKQLWKWLHNAREDGTFNE